MYRIRLRRPLGWCAAFLAAALAAPRAGAQDSTNSDDSKSRPHLTPYQWQKRAPTASDEGGARSDKPALRGLPQTQPQDPDELVCEQGVLHPTQGPSKEAAKQNPMILLGRMGVQHCWKRSDPKTIIERPVGMQDVVVGAVADSAARSFPPLKGPKPFLKAKDKSNKKSKAKAPWAGPKAPPQAPAPAIEPPPAKKEGADPSGGTPQLLR
jgi:hypothetical protein